jgi:hypothetical protein
MPLDIPTMPAEMATRMPAELSAQLPAQLMDSEPKFFEPLLPASAGDDWQGILRQIFATEHGLWQRRAVVRQSVAARG